MASTAPTLVNAFRSAVEHAFDETLLLVISIWWSRSSHDGGDTFLIWSARHNDGGNGRDTVHIWRIGHHRRRNQPGNADMSCDGDRTMTCSCSDRSIWRRSTSDIDAPICFRQQSSCNSCDDGTCVQFWYTLPRDRFR